MGHANIKITLLFQKRRDMGGRNGSIIGSLRLNKMQKKKIYKFRKISNFVRGKYKENHDYLLTMNRKTGNSSKQPEEGNAANFRGTTNYRT